MKPQKRPGNKLPRITVDTVRLLKAGSQERRLTSESDLFDVTGKSACVGFSNIKIGDCETGITFSLINHDFIRISLIGVEMCGDVHGRDLITLVFQKETGGVVKT